MSDIAERPGPLPKIDPASAKLSLERHAENYRRTALSLGAGEAAVIEARSIPVDDRVLLKCRVPLCSGYGTCGNCPPRCPSPDETRRLLAHFNTALVFRLAVPPSVIVPDEERKKDLKAVRRQLYAMVSSIESAAFYDGHYFATGFASGSCKSLYCSEQECAVMAGEKCRQNLRARPAMEAMGIDCFALSAGVGWEIYPIGKSASPDRIPAAFLMGLVLVG
jgi:predicted metal-binding protein